MGGPWLEVTSAFSESWTPQYRIFLCWNMLAWISVDDRIPFSFTNFITTPEFKLSCFLYTSPDSYHTQIQITTKYLLDTNFIISELFSLRIGVREEKS